MKTWARTGIQNLLRNEQSGRYYARFTIASKHKWIALKTTSRTVAMKRLTAERQKISQMNNALRNATEGVATMGQILLVYLAQVKAKKSIKERTAHTRCANAQTVALSYPGFDKLSPSDVTREKVELWRNRLMVEGSGRLNHFGKNLKTKGSSASTTNGFIDAFRHMLDLAVQHGQLATNPLAARGLKVKVKPRKPQLPEMAVIHRIFANIEVKGGIKGPDTADFLRLLTFTGMRVGENAALYWPAVDFAKMIIKVPGTKTDASDREVPIIADAHITLLRLKARRESAAKWAGSSPDFGPGATVTIIHEAQGSLTRACREEGAPRLTHHDLRDAFATQCIEAGVDIPTVAGWLGHKDGGALLMKVYAHHRRKHSAAQAAKVTFQ